jgi:hypothetical protein
MQFGTFASRLAALVVTSVLCGQTLAQSFNGPGNSSRPFNGSAGASPNSGAMQALYLTPAGGSQQSPYVDAYGNPVILPAGYGAPYPDGGGAPYCPPMDECPSYADGMMDAIGVPGISSEQCGPHYFDFRAEAVYMDRAQTFGDEVIFTKLVPQDGNGDPLPPVIGLTSNQLDYDFEPGFRVLGRYDLGPLSVLEFGYFGLFAWDTRASVVDPEGPDPNNEGDLFSLWSRPAGTSATDFAEYGTTPPEVQTAGGPMPQTERSLMHSVSLESDLQNAEMSYRRYWVGYSPKISGTLLAGFRYTQLDEEFHFQTMGLSEEGDFEGADYGVVTRNSLAGFQTGGDMWIHVVQGVRVGAEGKAGLYNNRVRLHSAMPATPPIDSEPGEFPEVAETFRRNQVAFITEASADVVVDILPSWSLRAGYEVMYINSIALAGENFNTGSPYGLVGQEPRVPFFASQGHALYHGAHVGLEYIW